MKNFVYENPTKIIFGRETIDKIGCEISSRGIKKILMVYGRNAIKKNGVYDTVLKSLRNANISVIELPGVKSNPVLSKVEEGIELARAQQIEGVLAVGGGSTFDSSKAIAAGTLYDGSVWDFFGRRKEAKAALPIFGVLTISATGSEMNGLGVVTNEQENKKWSLFSPLIYPTVSIIDPSVQTTLPREQTVNGAVDIISHVMELYFDGSRNIDVMDEYSEGIIRTVIKHVQVLLSDPNNYESRAQIAWCATLALNGSNVPGRRGGDFASHAIEHALSVWTDIAHGAGLAIVFPAWMRYVYKENIQQFVRFGEKIFNIYEGSDEERVLQTIDQLKEFYHKIGAPVSMREAGYLEKDLPAIADNVAQLGTIGNLKRLQREDVLEILKLAW